MYISALKIIFSTLFGGLLQVLLFCFRFLLLLYSRRKNEKHKTDAVKFRDPKDLEEYTKENKIQAENEKFEEKTNYWKLLYTFPIDLIIFRFFLTIIFIGSGGFALSLYIYYQIPIVWTKVLFLPIVFLLELFSLRLAFPLIFYKIIGAFLFYNSRSIFGIIQKVTIVEKLRNNPRFTMASDKLEKQTKVWKTLKQDFLTKQIMIFIVPDDIVENDRVDIFEKMDYDLSKFETFQCSNGILVINRER